METGSHITPPKNDYGLESGIVEYWNSGIMENHQMPSSSIRKSLRVISSNISVFLPKAFGTIIPITIILFLLCQVALGQVRYPVAANISTGFPQPVYLSDYYQAASNNLVVNMVLNDLNEPTWNARLKFTITGTDLKITTRQNMVPAFPIELTAGNMISIRDADLTEYLTPDRVTATGAAAGIFNQTGRLKEGVYNFCVEVLDYSSGVPISLPACATAWIQLKDPPLILSPTCGKFIAPADPQVLLFQWQPVTFGPNENAGIEYIINIHELTHDDANPMMALQNGQALQIFESDPVMATTYVYGIADPLLEVGKRYIYTVRAVDIDGRDLIKNRGYSEVCHFYYGYPEGGVLSIRAPKSGHSYGYDESPAFEWNCTDKRIPNQPFAYQLRMVKIMDNQDSLSAMEDNETWYTYSMPPTTSVTFKRHALTKTLDPLDRYAWQVVAYSGEQKVAESPVHTITGPPFLDQFNAGGYVVKVLKTENRDVNNLQGRCMLALGEDTLIADFEKLKLRYVNMKYFLEEGSIDFNDLDIDDIPLASMVAENDTAYFKGERVRLSKEGLKIFGYARLRFPHPTFDAEPPYINTKTAWFDFTSLRLTGIAVLDKDNYFELLDPLGFAMHLDTISTLVIDKNAYRARFTGVISLPEEEKTGRNIDLSLPFKQATHLLYFDKNTLSQQLSLPVTRKTEFTIDAEEMVFDLSDRISPGIHSNNKAWKGLYFEKYKVNINKQVDENDFWSPGIDHTIEVSRATAERYAWVSGGGLNFLLNYNFPASSNTGAVYTFPASLSTLVVRVENRSIRQSMLTGTLKVPFVSEKENFGFTIPLTYNGFSTGHLSGMENYKYVFNPASIDQKVPVKILRAEFEGKNRITASVDMDFPVLNADVPVVSDLKIWGNGEVGFKTPNGSVAFNKQINGKVSTFPIVVDAIGAGRVKDFYTIGAQIQLNMSEDVSGIAGAPVSNFYSVSRNSLLDEDYEPAEIQTGGGMWNPVLGEYSQKDLENLGDEEIGKLLVYEMESAFNSDPEDDLEMIQGLLHTAGISGPDKEVSYTIPSADELTSFEEDPAITRGGLFANMSEKEAALVEAIVAGFVDEMTRPITANIEGYLTLLAYKADSTIDHSVNKSLQWASGKIDTMMFGISTSLLSVIPDDKPSINKYAETALLAASNGIKKEAERSVRESVRLVIREPIVRDFSVVIPSRINDTIRTVLTKLVIRMMEGEISRDYVEEQVAGKLWETTKASGEYVYQQYIKPAALADRIRGVGDEFVRNFDWNAVLTTTKDEIIAKLVDPGTLAAIVAEEGVEKLTSHLVGDSKLGNELVSAGMSISRSVQFKDGKLALDPSNINIVTSWLSFTGVTNFRADDPVFGDVWDANVTIVIHKPKDMAFQGRYMNGKTKEGTDYWFAELSTAGNAGQAGGGGRIGGDISGDIQPLERPINLGVAKLAAASLRVYKHMIDTTGRGIVPDPNVKYGGYFHFVLLDGKNDGKIFRLELAGRVIQGHARDAFVLDFLGDLQIINSNPKIETADGKALAHAGIRIHYNGLEDHFIGYAFLEITSGVCLFASMEIESKPGYWHVYIGDEINKIRVTPGCVAWGGMGYMKLDPRVLEVALGVSYSLYFDKNLNLGVVKLGILIDAYAALGIVAGMQYKPNFKLLKAGIWLELYARVMLNYGINLGIIKKSGSLELLEFYLRASLILHFDPKPATLVGEADGYLRILNGLINAQFSARMEKTL